MKTKNFNIGKKLVVLISVAFISTVSFAATKENPKPVKFTEQEKMVFNKEIADLKSEALTGTLQDWMNNGSYWKNENSAEVSKSEISSELSKWMSDGSYWSEPIVKQEVGESFTSKLKSFMANGSYWNSEK